MSTYWKKTITAFFCQQQEALSTCLGMLFCQLSVKNTHSLYIWNIQENEIATETYVLIKAIFVAIFCFLIQTTIKAEDGSTTNVRANKTNSYTVNASQCLSLFIIAIYPQYVYNYASCCHLLSCDALPLLIKQVWAAGNKRLLSRKLVFPHSEERDTAEMSYLFLSAETWTLLIALFTLLIVYV